jgi:hypothetical protein
MYCRPGFVSKSKDYEKHGLLLSAGQKILKGRAIQCLGVKGLMVNDSAVRGRGSGSYFTAELGGWSHAAFDFFGNQHIHLK